MSAQTESTPAPAAVTQNSTTSASNGNGHPERHVFGPADRKANGIVGPPQRPLVRRPTPMNLKIPPGITKKAGGSPQSSPRALIEEEEEESS